MPRKATIKITWWNKIYLETKFLRMYADNSSQGRKSASRATIDRKSLQYLTDVSCTSMCKNILFQFYSI